MLRSINTNQLIGIIETEIFLMNSEEANRVAFNTRGTKQHSALCNYINSFSGSKSFSDFN